MRTLAKTRNNHFRNEFAHLAFFSLEMSQHFAHFLAPTNHAREPNPLELLDVYIWRKISKD